MKWYGCSLNYPQPESRPCGDIDTWMFGMPKAADEYIKKELSIEVHEDNDHHSVFQFDGFTIENHGMIMDDNIYESDRFINRVLEQSAKEGVREIEIDGTKIYIPSVKFNSIHLLRHMACDFATFTTSLRHVLDWATFISKNTSEVDWEYVHQIAHKANMHKFLDAINSICVEYLGYPKSMFPVEVPDDALRDRVMDDILNNNDRPDVPDANLSFYLRIHTAYQSLLDCGAIGGNTRLSITRVC